jgi:hypothetical protein
VSWRNCKASETLVAAVNQRWPHRSKASDGTIGDAAHATRVSDHNPWVIVRGQGVVRARDITAAGINAAWLAEKLRQLGRAGDKRLANGGYVIFNRRITSADFSRWVEYTGTNPHTKHIHVSFALREVGFDDPSGWWVDLFGPVKVTPAPARPVKPKPATKARPTIQQGSTLTSYVKDVQRRLKTFYPAYAGSLAVDGAFGPKTTAAVKEFQRRSGLTADGIVGKRTWVALGY